MSGKDKNFFWGLLSKEEMERMLGLAAAHGYRDAMVRVLEEKEYLVRYALDEGRADFKYLLPITLKSRVLDIGCGLGSVSISIARNAGFVCSIDPCHASLEFVALRAHQENIRNIGIMQCEVLDHGRLPFRSSSFDVVILNGVLEWIGSSLTEPPAEICQFKALKEIFRVLKPGGSLYIGIENRYGYPLFLGQRDGHTKLRFVTLLPRKIANLYSILVRRIPFRNYTYSYCGYSRLLENVGYSSIRFFCPLASYQTLEYMLPLDRRDIFRYFLKRIAVYHKGGSLKARCRSCLAMFLSFCGLYKYLVPSFGIVARVEK